MRLTFRVCGLCISLCLIALGQPVPNLQTATSAKGELVELSLTNAHNAPVEAYAVRTTSDAKGRHSWQLKVEDTILEGYPVMAPDSPTQVHLPAANAPPEVAVIYADGTSAGPEDLVQQIRTIRETVGELLPSARRKVAEFAGQAKSAAELARLIDAYKQQRLMGTLSRSSDIGKTFSISSLRQATRLAVPAGIANGILWRRILGTVQAGSQQSVGESSARVNAVLARLEADIKRSRESRH